MSKSEPYQKSYDTFVSGMQKEIERATDDNNTQWAHSDIRAMEVERLTLILKLEEVAALKRIAEYLKLMIP